MPPQRAPIDYLIALHELGHVVGDEARRLWRRNDSHAAYVATEAAAWSWAVHQIDPKVLKRMPTKLWQEVGDYWATHLRV